MGIALQRALQNAVRDPLFHFLAAAAALFLLLDSFGPAADAPSREISVTREGVLTYMQRSAGVFDQDRHAALFDELTPAERSRLVADFVRDEVLYREAKALGLDLDDYVIRNRLIQKLEFVSQGVIDARTAPTEDEIQAWFEARRADYAVPPKISFAQVYFSTDRHGLSAAETRAVRRLEVLNQTRAHAHEAVEHGDAGPYRASYVREDRTLVASHFGDAAADVLFAAQPDPTLWRGPYTSPHGVHLILLTERTDGYDPPLEAVQERVENDVLQDLRRRRLESTIDEIVAGYLIHDVDGLYTNGSEAAEEASGG